MAEQETYPDIPSPSSQSFRTFEDDATPTPLRTGTHTPIRQADERSKLLDRSADDFFAGYGAEQAIERRRKTSTYSVINTGTTSGAGLNAVHRSNGDGVGEPSVSFLLRSAIRYSRIALGTHTVDPPGPPKPVVSKLTSGNWRKRMSYYVPVTSWIPGYSWSLYVSLCLYTVRSFLVRNPCSCPVEF